MNSEGIKKVGASIHSFVKYTLPISREGVVLVGVEKNVASTYLRFILTYYLGRKELVEGRKHEFCAFLNVNKKK